MLTPIQKKIYDYLKCRMQIGLPPTVREICAATGLKSTSSAHAHLKTLEKKGYITRDARLNRAIHIVGKDENKNPDAHTTTLQVPVLGKVAAGTPITAVEEVEGYVPYAPTSSCDNNFYFALTIHGESMRDIGIMDGDAVIVKKTPEAENGEIVVAMIDGEATVKRFFREETRVRLQPENADFKPIYTDHVDILGKVVALYRQF